MICAGRGGYRPRRRRGAALVTTLHHAASPPDPGTVVEGLQLASYRYRSDAEHPAPRLTKVLLVDAPSKR